MKRRQAAAVFAAVVAGLFAFDFYVVGPQSRVLREQIGSTFEAVRRDENYLRDAGATGGEVAALERRIRELEGGLIQEKTEFLASARLQEALSRMAEKAGVQMTTVRPLTAVRAGRFNGIPLYAEGGGNIRQISGLLREIESEGMLLKVDKLSISVTNLQSPRELRFKIQISGLARP